jgi:hypothetical protein
VSDNADHRIITDTPQQNPRLTRQMLEDELERARIRRVNVSERAIFSGTVLPTLKTFR